MHIERIRGRLTAGRTDALIAAALMVVTLAVYLRTLAPDLTWRNDGADGGDLVAAAASFGIPHPSGYPTYMLLARAFLLLPAGTEAYRLNLLSALSAGAAVAICYRLCLVQTASPRTRAARAGAATSALLLAFSPAVWSQATITEVYTLHLFFVSALLYLMLRWHHFHRLGDAACAGLLLGLGLGNHLTLVLILPALILYFNAHAREANGGWRKALAALVLGLGFGLSVYLYLPLASRLGTNLHWGRIDSAASFVAHVGGKLYQGYLFALPPAEYPIRLAATFTLLVASYQLWGLVLACVGYRTLWRADRTHALAVAVISAGTVLFAVGYNTSDSLHYLLPLWLMAALCVAAGIEKGWGALSRLVPGTRLPRVAVVALAVFTLGLSLWRYSEFDLSADDQVAQFSRRTLAALPAGAIALTVTDRQTFALWYLTEVRGTRSDVIVVDRDLLAYDPYLGYLRERWHTLPLGNIVSAVSVTGSDGVQHPVVLLPE